MKLRQMTLTALAAALIFVTTIIIQIPNGIGGYIHMGDALLITFAMLLPSRSAFFAAAIGSSMADLMSGYTIYIIPTFIIKGCMSLCFHHHTHTSKVSNMLSMLASCIILVGGYFITECILYQSVATAAISILPNIIQVGFGCVVAYMLYPIMERLLQSTFKKVI